MARYFLLVGTLVALVIVFVATLSSIRRDSEIIRNADLLRMDTAGFRSQLSVISEDSGPFQAGQYIHLRLEAKNTGSVVWKKDEEHYIALGQFTRRPIDVFLNREGHACKHQIRYRPKNDINPGESFVADVEIPGRSRGFYHQRFQMLKEGNPPDGGWFGPIITCQYEVR